MEKMSAKSKPQENPQRVNHRVVLVRSSNLRYCVMLPTDPLYNLGTSTQELICLVVGVLIYSPGCVMQSIRRPSKNKIKRAFKHGNCMVLKQNSIGYN